MLVYEQEVGSGQPVLGGWVVLLDEGERRVAGAITDAEGACRDLAASRIVSMARLTQPMMIRLIGSAM